jgi:hypothetical protein
METPEPSDQLPEEGPSEQVPDDAGSAQEGASEHARRQSGDRDDDGGRDGQATGNPKSAG